MFDQTAEEMRKYDMVRALIKSKMSVVNELIVVYQEERCPDISNDWFHVFCSMSK